MKNLIKDYKIENCPREMWTLNIDKWVNYLNSGTITLNGTHNINVSRLTGNWDIIEQ